MKFKSLKIFEWQQFQSIDINFHDRLTILTGANGSGKTTILAYILAKHCGWNMQSLSTPKKDKKSGIVSFLSRLFDGSDHSTESNFGELVYSSGQKAILQVPNQNSAQYVIQLSVQEAVLSFYIPSYRSIFRYQPLTSIPFGKKDKKQAFNEVSSSIINRFQGGNDASPSFFMKNTLIGWAIQGYGVKSIDREIMPPDSEQVRYYEGFKEVLKKLLPTSLGFENFEIREKEIVFICNGGKDEFILEQVSGGISALIDIAWQIYMFSTKEKDEFTVIIDEVENHLHPVMQREILPNLLDAFPEASFIVSTHSPLVVGSVKESNVYALRYNEQHKIVSSELDLVDEAKTASEILDEVLGVSFTMPIWVEEKLDRIVHDYSRRDMTRHDFANMRKDLKDAGLEKLLPNAVADIADTDLKV